MYFCIMNYIGTKGEVCRQLKIFLKPRSKAVVPVLFCVALWFIPRAAKCFKFSHALCPRFSVCFSILITLLGEEGAGLCASRTFVCLFCACMFLSVFSSF